MKILVVLSIAIFLSLAINAQNIIRDITPEQDNTPEIINKLNLRQDQRLTNMVGWHIKNNQAKKGMDGWRVEIFFSSSNDGDGREKALKVKQEFMSKYPDIEAHIKFVAPDFKVRVGDFRTKSEALKLKKEIIGIYPKSFEVKDVIKIPDFNPGG